MQLWLHNEIAAVMLMYKQAIWAVVCSTHFTLTHVGPART